MFIGVVPLHSVVSTKLILGKWTGKRCDCRAACGNNFAGEHQGKLVHTQLTARGLAHFTPTEKNCSWKPAPPWEKRIP